MQWNPNKNEIATVIQLISASSHPCTNEEHKIIYNKIKEAESHPEFSCYLAFILGEMKEQPLQIRQLSGILLKNIIQHKTQQNNFPYQYIQYIKSQLLKTINDSEKIIQNTASLVIINIILRYDLVNWPDLMQQLIQMLSSNDNLMIRSALKNITNIAEDIPEQCLKTKTQPFFDAIIPKLIHFISSPLEECRILALTSLNCFLFLMPQILSQNLQNLTQTLFQLMNDSSPDIKILIIKSICTLFLSSVNLLHPNIDQIHKYIILCLNDSDELVAREACDYLNHFCQSEIDHTVIIKCLPELLPILLKNMMYSEENLAVIDEQETSAAADKNILPQFSGSIQERKNDGWGNPAQDSVWDLRKAAASALDILAVVLDSELLKHLLPILEKSLRDDVDWKIRESCILALGAIAEGCSMSIRSHLERIFSYLLRMIKKDHLLVRSISCWTLSRYATFCLDFPDETFLRPVLNELLSQMLSDSYKVQEAACSALATFEETIGANKLRPILPQIIQTLMSCYQKYKMKNLLILYDALMTLINIMDEATLNNANCVQMIIQPLLKQYHALANDDKRLFSLFECLGCLAVNLKQGFVPFSKPIFERCLVIIKTVVEQEQQMKTTRAQNHEAKIKFPDIDYLVSSLDLIASLIEGIGSNFDPFLENSIFLELVYHCTKSDFSDVRQSAFALLGDLSKTLIGRVKPFLKDFMSSIVDNLVPYYPSVCNNASWCTGEISVRVGDQMNEYIKPLMSKLIPILNEADYPIEQNLLSNIAITIGRLGFACPLAVAPFLSDFAQKWCIVMTTYQEDQEKEYAFRGFCMVIAKNHEVMLPFFVEMSRAFTTWKNLSDVLKKMFLEIFQSYKVFLGEKWDMYFDKCDLELKNRINEICMAGNKY